MKKTLNKKPMMSRKERANRFWHWFMANHKKYLIIGGARESQKERLIDEFFQQLKKYNKEICFELGEYSEGNKVELVITAEGVKKHYEDVEYLVSLSPKIDSWNVVAFKPAMGLGFTTEYGNIEFDPYKTIFIPLDSEEHPERVGVRVCYADYEDEDQDEKEVVMRGTYLMLEVILGEKSALSDIDYLEIVQTPDDIDEYEFLYLNEIEQFIKDKKSGAAQPA